MTQHHFCGQDQWTWVHVIFTCILRCCTVSRFEHRDRVRQVCTWSDTDTTNLSSQCIGDVIAVQVQCSDNAVFCWTQQDLLQERVSDGILNNDFFACFWILEFAPWATIDQFSAEFFLCQCICPITEATFGVLHDVTFVNDSHRWLVIVDRVLNCFAYQTLCTFDRNWFYADTRCFWEADFLHAHFVLQELDQFLDLIRALSKFNARIDIFRVFTEDHHVGFFWFTYWRWHAFEVTHWTQTNIQIQLLAQSHVQRTDAAAYWRCQWTFDGNNVIFQCRQSFFWQPNIWAVNFSGFFTRENFHPADFTFAAVGFCYRCINYLDHDWADINTSTVTLDVRNNWIFWNIQWEVSIDGNFLTFCRYFNMLIHRFLRGYVQSSVKLWVALCVLLTCLDVLIEHHLRQFSLQTGSFICHE